MHPKRRRFQDFPEPFKIVTCGMGTVIAASGRLKSFADSVVQMNPYGGDRIFAVDCLTRITDVMRHENCMLASCINFIPKSSARHHMLDFSNHGITLRIYDEPDIKRLLLPLAGFENALSHKDGLRTDVIAACAVKNNRIIAIAGASNDSDIMWQVGIDVLPEFRNEGIGSTLVSILTDEITALGKLPYYSCQPSNIASIKTAVACGYTPMFTEIFALH
jgi:GNAT superfamily N-acetyltransferase